MNFFYSQFDFCASVSNGKLKKKMANIFDISIECKFTSKKTHAQSKQQQVPQLKQTIFVIKTTKKKRQQIAFTVAAKYSHVLKHKKKRSEDSFVAACINRINENKIRRRRRQQYMNKKTTFSAELPS